MRSSTNAPSLSEFGVLFAAFCGIGVHGGGSGAPAFGAEEPGARPEIRAARVEEGPVIDGDLTDPVWDLAERGGPLIQVEPVIGGEPTERTEFRILHDRRALYIGVWCFDREPDRIIALEMSRDGYMLSEDHIIIALDTFLDRRNGYEFLTNPTGARADALIIDNINLNGSWDGIWEVGARIDDEGWKAEIAIPFSSLSFDPAKDRWGFNISRQIGRRSEPNRWSAARPDIYTYNVAEAGDLVGLEGLGQGLGIEIAPYLLADFTHTRSPLRDDLDIEFGIDLRYNLTPALAATLSYNTDFAETEVDARQVNLTRFPLFFPEKRRFFLEDASLFAFGGLEQQVSPSGSTEQSLTPYFSRRIGLGDDGKVVPILLAGKLTGRAGDYRLGMIDALLDTDDFGHKNAFVARVSRNIGERASAGLIATAGDPNSDDEALLGGIDFGYRTSEFLGSQILLANAFLAGTWTENVEGGDNLSFGGKISMPNDLYTFDAGFYQVDRNFNPALGFAPRRGVRNYNGILRYRPRLESGSVIRQIFFNYLTSNFTDLDDRLQSASHNFFPVYILFESAEELYLSANWQFDAPEEDFEIHPGVAIPPDDYWWGFYRLGFLTARKRPVSIQFDWYFGDFYDGEKDTYSTAIILKPMKYFSIDLGYALNRVRLPEGDFDTRLASARLQVSLTPDLAWYNFIQYDDVTDTIGFNSRIRWEFRPGMTAYLVLNQGYERENGGVTLQESGVTAKLGVILRF